MSATRDLRAAATGEQKNPVALFRGFLEKQRTQIEAALPKHITADRMIRLACTEFSKNPGLQKCTVVSVFGGIIQAAQLGLEIGVNGQAYLVPFNNRKSNQLEAQFIPGYKGLIALARRSGEVTSIETNIAYANDQFDLKLGLSTEVTHIPYLDGDRGAPRLVYGVAKFRDGGYHFEWMTIAEVNKTRARSKAADNGPWVTDYDQMVRKTLIRRMANYLPMSIELQNAIQISDAVDEGKHATIDSGFVVVDDENDDHADEGQKAREPRPEPEKKAAAVDQNTGEIIDQQHAVHLDAEQAKVVAPQAPRTPARPANAAEIARAGGIENAGGSWTPTPEEQAAIRAREMAEATEASRPAPRRPQRERGDRLNLE